MNCIEFYKLSELYIKLTAKIGQLHLLSVNQYLMKKENAILNWRIAKSHVAN